MTDSGPREPSGPDAPAFWDARYRTGGELWGETPSELAAVAMERLATLGAAAADLTLLDLGCGYGRDDVVLWRALGLSVVGVDGAARAIEMARAALPAGARVEYRHADFGAAGFRLGPVVDGRPGPDRPTQDRFDVVYCSNVYHLLEPASRGALRAAMRRSLAPGGLVFVSTLSVRDPEHAGKGRPVPGEPGSFVTHAYLHLSDRGELAADFDWLEVERLDEIAYLEGRPHGAPHRHVSWVLVGRAP